MSTKPGRPWHDTARHECGGPVVPFIQARPHTVSDVTHVRCAACGADWTEEDARTLVRIWWSQGAYDGLHWEGML